MSPITGTGISIVTDRLWSLRVFYQLQSGNVGESKHLDGVWTNDSLTVQPADGSPFASVTYDSGKQIRLYYLDTSDILQEYCFTAGKGWFQGEISQLKVKCVPTAGLAAVEYGDDKGGVHLRVYYQEAGTDIIAEAANDGYWHAGQLRLAGAIGGTQLAAVAYYFQSQQQIRVYYQAKDLNVREHGHNDGGWFTGGFVSGKATALTPIAALAFSNVQLQVYFRDSTGHVVFVKNTGSWGSPFTIEAVGPGHKFAVLQWESGKRLRFYYQEFSGPVRELCSDDSGSSWFPGSLKVN